MIRLSNLGVRVGGFSVTGVSLDIRNGEYFVLLGPSGAGKTVLIETLMGLHHVSTGSVEIDGVEVTELPPEERYVAYIPQDCCLFPHLSVRDNLLFGARARGMSKLDREKRVTETVDLLDIRHLVDRPDVISLSGGERQRVAIARALIVNPKVLFLDEPFSAIDEYLKVELLKKLLQIRESLGVTMFHVTHDHREAFFLGDSIGVMLAGRLHQVDSRDGLYHRPQTIEAARFLMTRNIFEGIVEEISPDGEEALVSIGVLRMKGHPSRPMAVKQRVWAGIRPEEVKIDPLPIDWTTCDAGDCNAMRGVIRRRREQFSSFQFEVEVAALAPVIESEVLKRRTCHDELPAGAEVKICLSRRSLWLLPRD